MFASQVVYALALVSKRLVELVGMEVVHRSTRMALSSLLDQAHELRRELIASRRHGGDGGALLLAAHDAKQFAVEARAVAEMAVELSERLSQQGCCTYYFEATALLETTVNLKDAARQLYSESKRFLYDCCSGKQKPLPRYEPVDESAFPSFHRSKQL